MNRSDLIKLLRSVPYDTQPISDYNRRYIRRLLPVLEYYFDIYERALPASGLESLTMVDYGGGHGFFSFFAKSRGVGQVVYVDINPDSVATVQAISDYLAKYEIAPDVVLQGDSRDLRQWCEKEEVKPDWVIGMDVIEHVYCLDDFFGDLFSLSGDMKLLFTTASNPHNRRIVRKLHKVIKKDEALFWSQRRAFIQERFSQLKEDELDYWATNTRGLDFNDVLRAVESETPNLLRDRYNTCDPTTSSWTERILPLSDYANIAQSYNYRLEVVNGFYNASNTGLKGFVQRYYNRALAKNRCRSKAPFLYLRFESQNKTNRHLD